MQRTGTVTSLETVLALVTALFNSVPNVHCLEAKACGLGRGGSRGVNRGVGAGWGRGGVLEAILLLSGELIVTEVEDGVSVQLLGEPQTNVFRKCSILYEEKA